MTLARHHSTSPLTRRRADWPDQPIQPRLREGFTIRPGELKDGAFIDQCQKVFKGHLGFLYSGTIEKKISSGDVLVVVDENDVPYGFVMGTKSYDRNDAVSRIDQIAVVPIKQRKQVGSALLAEWIRRLPYGVTLICCWCAQDLRENRFWEAEGFQPLAFRAGGMSANRVHIFWERRCRRGDTGTPFWYPKETSNGAMAAARLILPIPPGTDWAEVEFPRILPTEGLPDQKVLPNGLPDPKALPPKLTGKAKVKATMTPAEYAAQQRERQKHLQQRAPGGGRLVPTMGQGGPAQPQMIQSCHVGSSADEKPKKPRPKNKSEHVAAARELRDRFLEQVNALQIEEQGKYDPTRLLEESPSCMTPEAKQLMAQIGMTPPSEDPHSEDPAPRRLTTITDEAQVIDRRPCADAARSSPAS